MGRKGRSDRVADRVGSGDLIELYFDGRLMPVKRTCWEAYDELAAIRSGAAAIDLDVVVSAAEWHGVFTLHFQFNSWKTAKRVIDWWPGSGTWRSPGSKDAGKTDDWREVLEHASSSPEIPLRTVAELSSDLSR